MTPRALAGRLALLLLAGCIAACQPQVQMALPIEPPAARLPIADGSLRFAVIGDTGTGGDAQYDIGRRLAEAHQRFAFDFVLMVGDNMYGFERPQDFARKFELPYAALLDAGVQFYAALGNHDNPNQRYYEPFNMKGERYYSFHRGNATFFALDSNYMDERQLAWLKAELESAREPWRIAFFHHPLYSSGAFHGAEVDLRERIEPLFVAHGVNVVFAGHEHFYERIKPQKGIYYFISGAAAKLRRGNIRRSEITERGLDSDYSFMLVEIADDVMSFEAIARSGTLVDAGAIRQVRVEAAK